MFIFLKQKYNYGLFYNFVLSVRKKTKRAKQSDFSSESTKGYSNFKPYFILVSVKVYTWYKTFYVSWNHAVLEPDGVRTNLHLKFVTWTVIKWRKYSLWIDFSFNSKKTSISKSCLRQKLVSSRSFLISFNLFSLPLVIISYPQMKSFNIKLTANLFKSVYVNFFSLVG